MVRENRIKDYTFSAFAVNGSEIAKTFSNHVLNGEILKIRATNISSPGSFWVAESGTDIEIWRKNDFTSGLASFEVYPFTYLNDSVNTTGSPQAFGMFVTSNILYIAGSGFTSGTSKTFGPVTVVYR